MAMSKEPGEARDRERYGVGEWFGKIVANLKTPQLNELAAKAVMGIKAAEMPCPFRQAVDPRALCNKKGGVCSLQVYREVPGGAVAASGEFVTMCPSRFWHDANVFRWVGQTMIGTSKPIMIKEVDFLDTLPAAPDVGDLQATGDAVGRIDAVLIHPNDPREWCTLELQAVYFSGSGMPTHLAQFADPGLVGLPFPDKTRRPDFRSSGPKRLMPQLQTKVPTLRRWGRKMAVVVDQAFFRSLGTFNKVPHLSNCDIVWFVVTYDPASGTIGLVETTLSTLESSVDALTAGVPRSRDAFEGRLSEILSSKDPADLRKVIRIA